MLKSQFVYNFRFIIVGDSSVGKSCILVRLLKDQFKDNHEVTLGVEFASKVIPVDNQTNIKLQVWDTAGQEKFRSIARQYYRNAICCILVYDITSVRSFKSCKKWLEEIREHSQPKVMIMLIGNKSDLEDKRQVSTTEAERFASAEGLLFLETSALNADNVLPAFQKAAREVYKGVLTMKYTDVDANGELIGI